MGLEDKLPSGILLSTVEGLAGYMRKSSVWPATFGLACCAIEMMAVGSAPKHDISRFGMERMSFTPRQADLLIVAGTISKKLAPVLQKVYEQMAEPKWVLSVGACASSGGIFDTYSVLQGIDRIIPVDVYVPGCPPRPEQIIDGVMNIHRLVKHEPMRRRYSEEYRHLLGNYEIEVTNADNDK
mgnify:CR=1 FL=1